MGFGYPPTHDRKGKVSGDQRQRPLQDTRIGLTGTRGLKVGREVGGTTLTLSGLWV